jgi:ABC-2 type transport system ATP-binding protein
LLQVLPARGYRVRALAHTLPSLEDVFLAATRRSWDARLSDKANGSRAPLPKF